MSHSPLSAEIPAAPPGVRLTTLANGLTIIVREDHSAPVVSAQAWAAAGSIHEDRWLGAGLSHVLEHMPDLIAFLASPRAGYISGSIVTIDGGIASRGSIIKEKS